MTERKFTRGLHKPGMAAQLRETVSQVVRESAVLNKPLMVEPIDFEAFVSKNKTLIQNDPQRELLMYPNDDVSEIIMPRKARTTSKSIIDRFEPANDAIICPLHGTNGSATSCGISRQISSSSSISNGHQFNAQRQNSIQSTTSQPLNGNLSRKNSQQSASRTSINSVAKSPTSSHESYESALSFTTTTSNTSLTLQASSKATNSTATGKTSAGASLTAAAAASSSSSSSTLKSTNLAQPEDDFDLNGDIGERSTISSTSLNSLSAASSGSSAVAMSGTRAECTRFTRQALYTYRAKNHLIHYKYNAYGGTCHELPKINPTDDALQEEIYEIDADQDRIDELMTRSQADTITKQGYLLKGPDTNSDRMFANIGNKSFKRRYCYLRREVDGTWILELHKDERQGEAKATIVMDFCTEVVQNPKRGRFCFELHMTDGHKSFTLAAENDDEFKDWLSKLHSVLQQNKIQEDKRVASLERAPPPSPSAAMLFGTLKGLDQSMNPQLMKYGRETDISIAQARREMRRRLFAGYQSPTTATTNGPSAAPSTDNVDQYREHFGKRIFIACKSLRFRLQCTNEGGASDGERLCQVEPYHTTLALYDAKAGRKLTESFHFNINETNVCDMLPPTPVPSSVAACCVVSRREDERNENVARRRVATTASSLFEGLSDELVSQCPPDYLKHVRQAIFSITAPHPDIFLVLRVEKILQGNIVAAAEPYVKAGRDPRIALKLHKSARNYAQTIGHYRQPFAWAAKPLFRLYSSELDTERDEFEFGTLYRQEVNKLRDDELLKLLAEFRKPDKLSKLTIIPGRLRLFVKEFERMPGCLSKSLVPLSDFRPSRSNSGYAPPSLEITEFQSNSERDTHPYTAFCNHLFVYPLNLQFDSQKLFSRARNITVVVELRDSDDAESRPLQCIYGRPGHDYLVAQIAVPVLHHNTTPSWYEEIKMRLPLGLRTEHHLLFSFYHVSCNLSKKREATASFETPIGYAWLPLLVKGRINLEEQVIAVASSLPAGYLSIQPLGLGRGNCGPDIQWIDNQRPLYTVALRLDSTVLTGDQHLHNFFAHCERLLEGGRIAVLPAETETCKILKAAHAIDISALINFLPTVLNELFTLLVHTQSEDIGLNIIRLLINIIHMIVEEAGRRELLASYVKFVFHAPYFSQKANTTASSNATSSAATSSSSSSTGSSPTGSIRTVHGELCRHLPTILHPNNTDFLVVNKFMRYSSIFFEVIIKSMAQHLLDTGRIRMMRNERFPPEYPAKVEHLVKVLMPYLIARHKDLPVETQQLNRSLSQFIRRCLTFMDRGFVFRLVRFYLEQFSGGAPRTLQQFKFNFLQQICQHEHYVPLNLPFVLNPKNRPPEMMQHFALSEDFCRQHFLAGALLLELRGALNEVSPVRRHALAMFKNLLAKHELDDRYQHRRGQLSRIALLYVPWLGIVMDNLHRIDDQTEVQTPNGHVYADAAAYTQRLSCASSGYVYSVKDACAIASSNSSTPRSKNRLTLTHIDQTSPLRASVHLRETNFLAAIAGGQAPIANGNSDGSLNSFNSDSQGSQDTTTIGGGLTNGHQHGDLTEVALRNGHNRSVSVTQTLQHSLPRSDKFNAGESRDLLMGFLFVLKHLAQDQMVGWWQNCSESEILAFFGILELCLVQFRYVGKKHLQLHDDDDDDAGGDGGVSGDVDAGAGKEVRRSTAKANTLPARTAPVTSLSLLENGNAHETATNTLTPHSQTKESLIDETVRAERALYDANLACEVGMIILDCLGLYVVQFRTKLNEDGMVLPRLARVYLRFLQLGQSECLSRHVFAALRAFINNFSPALFKGTAILCGQMVYELLKACDSRLVAIRHESCAVLYLLMRSNFEFSSRKGLTRVHLQVIISVSQMIGNVIGLNNARFQESLSLINSYANSDKAMKGTGFPIEVKDLTRRVRTVLMATAQMQAHHMDPERLLELQYSLANSYASTPELRHTWLVTMARNHEQNGNISEAACCHLHIAALMSEYLRLRGGCNVVTWGAMAFASISRNIARDEQGLKLDAGAQDSQYTEQMLLDQLKQCADFLDRAERFECLGDLYKLILPMYERRRCYIDLAQSYAHLTQAYNKIVEVNRSGKRMLGRFYRVVFYGLMYFEEDHAVEYVYKEPKLTSLSEISQRLAKQYRDKFGVDVVKLIMDSSPVNMNELDPKLAYIQVTHVMPFFTTDELDQRLNEFEQNHDVDTFMYETPFTKAGTAHGSVEEQWKRKTVIKSIYSFPYVLKRIPVKSSEIIELSPIEVAIDEMQMKVSELGEVILPPADVKKLQLRLQGSIAVTVNAGPLAYAQAFLDPKVVDNFSLDRVEDLKDVFRDFIGVCHTALQLNARIISSDQKEYHLALTENYEKLCRALSELLDEPFQPLDDNASASHRNSMALFNAISGASNNSSFGFAVY